MRPEELRDRGRDLKAKISSLISDELEDLSVDEAEEVATFARFLMKLGD